jgi:hypothetical protein
VGTGRSANRLERLEQRGSSEPGSPGEAWRRRDRRRRSGRRSQCASTRLDGDRHATVTRAHPGLEARAGGTESGPAATAGAGPPAAATAAAPEVATTATPARVAEGGSAGATVAPDTRVAVVGACATRPGTALSSAATARRDAAIFAVSAIFAAAASSSSLSFEAAGAPAAATTRRDQERGPAGDRRAASSAPGAEESRSAATAVAAGPGADTPVAAVDSVVARAADNHGERLTRAHVERGTGPTAEPAVGLVAGLFTAAALRALGNDPDLRDSRRHGKGLRSLRTRERLDRGLCPRRPAEDERAASNCGTGQECSPTRRPSASPHADAR